MKTKKTLTTALTVLFIVLVTATFGVAEATASTIETFPFFQFGCLALGGLILTSLKNKYEKLYFSEVVSVFSLYAILVALFTSPVIEAIKYIVT